MKMLILELGLPYSEEQLAKLSVTELENLAQKLESMVSAKNKDTWQVDPELVERLQWKPTGIDLSSTLYETLHSPKYEAPKSEKLKIRRRPSSPDFAPFKKDF